MSKPHISPKTRKLLAIAAILFTPVFHRFLHRFHLAEAKRKAGDGS